MRGEIRAVACLILAAVLGTGCDDNTSSEPFVFGASVSAAASLVDVLRAISLEALDDLELPMLNVQVAGSEILMRQVRQGYRPALLIMARPLTEDERALGLDSSVLVTNQLVVGVRASDPDPPRALSDLHGAGLIAFADPTLAPAGAWARDALVAAGEWEALSPQFLEAQNVRVACGWLLLEEARAVICYRSDVVALDGLVEAFPLGELPVPFEALVLTQDGHETLAGLRSPEARAVFERYGFEPVP